MKQARLITAGILLILLALVPAGASDLLTQPLGPRWFYQTDTTRLAPVAQQDKVFVPIAEGKVVALSLERGELLWTSTPGGELSASPLATEKELFIATRRDNGPGQTAGGVLRVLDQQTGLTLRSFDFASALTSLVQQDSVLYAGAADGKFFALRPENGTINWTVQTGAAIQAPALITADRIYVGSTDGYLYALNPADGRLQWKFKTESKIVSPAATDGQQIFFGTADGYVYALKARDGQLDWRFRTGAAVEAPPLLVNRRLLVGSLDNFLYSLCPDNGASDWRQRVQYRITAPPIVAGRLALVAPLRSRTLSVFGLEEGALLNEIVLPESAGEIVAEPILVGATLIVPTDLGILALTAAPIKPPTK